MKEKIVAMLSSGLSATVVARAVGVSDGYVSQLMADEGIRAQVAEARLTDIEVGVKIDRTIEEIEEASLKRIKELLPYITRPMDAARIFQTMNGAKKRVAEITNFNTNPTAPLVNINISMEAATKFKLSSDKQIVEIDGRSMAPMAAKTLTGKVLERREARPVISDATSASQLLDKIELGIPPESLAHVL